MTHTRTCHKAKYGTEEHFFSSEQIIKYSRQTKSYPSAPVSITLEDGMRSKGWFQSLKKTDATDGVVTVA